jgi:hypothetical protein
MQAPEKIYRTTFYLDDDKGDTKWKKTPVAGAENIEYVRKDAFVEKVWEYFAPHINDNSGGYDRAFVLEGFKKYMKGE